MMMTGVKVSRNAWKFKPGAFRLQNYWILQPEPTFWDQQVSKLRYSNPTVSQSFKFHIFTIKNSQC